MTDDEDRLYAEDLHFHTRPRQSLSDALAELERTDPAVAAAVARLDALEEGSLRQRVRNRIAGRIKRCKECGVLGAGVPIEIGLEEGGTIQVDHCGDCAPRVRNVARTWADEGLPWPTIRARIRDGMALDSTS